MKKIFAAIIDKSFLKSPRNYIVQSLLATLAVLIILIFVKLFSHAAIVAALGSSTFLVFAMPNGIASQPRRLIGGHITGLVCGIICYYAFFTGPLGGISRQTDVVQWIAAACAVGLSIFLMTILNFEHPPAAGTALGIVASEWSTGVIIFVLAFAVSLAIVKRLMRGYLRDLC